MLDYTARAGLPREDRTRGSPMPTPYRKPKHQAKPSGVIVTCPSCGRKGRVAKSTAHLRCSECGKEFKPGGGASAGRTFILIVLAFVVMAGVGYFALTRAGKTDAEEKAKAAAEERLRHPLEQAK